jgi:hypothetical protein
MNNYLNKLLDINKGLFFYKNENKKIMCNKLVIKQC